MPLVLRTLFKFYGNSRIELETSGGGGGCMRFLGEVLWDDVMRDG